MASWYLGVYEIAENTSLATALDVVNALKIDLPGMSIVSHLEDASAARDVAHVDRMVRDGDGGGGATATDDGGWQVNWVSNWWFITGRIYPTVGTSRSSDIDAQSPVMLVHRSRDQVIYGPDLAGIGRLLLGRDALTDVIAAVREASSMPDRRRI